MPKMRTPGRGVIGGIVDIVDTVDTADIVHTVDTLDIVKSVNSVDNVSSVNSVHNVHNASNDTAAGFQGLGLGTRSNMHIPILGIKIQFCALRNPHHKSTKINEDCFGRPLMFVKNLKTCQPLA